MIPVMLRSTGLLLSLIFCLSLGPTIGTECEQTSPLVLIYCQDEQGYGEDLIEILRDDGGIEAEFLVLTDSELLKNMIYCPHVKLLITVFNEAKQVDLGEHLEYFFRTGGGLVGLGFSGWRATTLNASEKVYPLNATSYATGRYDREKGVFTQDLYVDQEHEISDGLGNFTAYTQKIIMSLDRASGKLLPVEPSGELTVVYREYSKNAPAVIAYRDSGASVTIGGFTGNSIERAPTHYRLFTREEGFRRLLTNSANWAWKNENRYVATLSSACEVYQTAAADGAEVIEDVESEREKRNSSALVRTSIVLVLMVLGIAIVIRTCFLGGGEKEGN